MKVQIIVRHMIDNANLRTTQSVPMEINHEERLSLQQLMRDACGGDVTSLSIDEDINGNFVCIPTKHIQEITIKPAG